MVTTIKVLKRKDGASLVAGVVLALITANFVSSIVSQLAFKISNLGSGNSAATEGWRSGYLLPVVLFILELIALEILVWLYIALHDSVGK